MVNGSWTVTHLHYKPQSPSHTHTHTPTPTHTHTHIQHIIHGYSGVFFPLFTHNHTPMIFSHCITQTHPYTLQVLQIIWLSLRWQCPLSPSVCLPHHPFYSLLPASLLCTSPFTTSSSLIFLSDLLNSSSPLLFPHTFSFVILFLFLSSVCY